MTRILKSPTRAYQAVDRSLAAPEWEQAGPDRDKGSEPQGEATVPSTRSDGGLPPAKQISEIPTDKEKLT